MVYAQLGQIRTSAIQQSPPPGPFFDVPEANPRAGYLGWARANDVVDPKPNGNFAPTRPVSRADDIYWLWRFAGRPTASGSHGFSDIPAQAYYRTAVRWGRQEGIVAMTSDGKFHASQAVTRELAVLWLWRWAGKPNPHVPNDYTDVPDTVGSRIALDWADASKLVPTPTFGRGARITRAEAVLLLYRLRHFDDVPPSHFAADAIRWADLHVIAQGYAHNRFKPGEGVNRGQGVVWIWRTMDRPDTPAPPNDPFNDDDEAAWYADALDWAADAGWVEGQGGSSTTFAPDATLNRGDAVSWIWRMVGSTPSSNTNTFTDVPNELDDAVDWADEHDIATGFNDGTFRPNVQVTRAQFMRMLFRTASTEAAWTVDPPSTVLF
jgi:hypothetical protein